MSDVMFVMTAQKRAVSRKSRSSDWEPDTESFERRWPNGRKPDIGVRRSTNHGVLAAKASRMNAAQIDADYLDWLFVVDIDAPIHKCEPACTN